MAATQGAGALAPAAPVTVTAAAPLATIRTISADLAGGGGSAATGAPAPIAAPATAPRLTNVAPGSSQSDADFVEATLGVLRRSPSGAAVVDRLLAVGARINVVSDAEFQQMGYGEAHAFYDPQLDTVFMRRSASSDVAFAAVTLAHEGMHLLDDVARLDDPFVAQASAGVASLGGPSTPQGAEAQRQALFELTMIKEARAFTFAGQVARELAVQLPDGDPTKVAQQGGNDQATYARVWQALLGTRYNPEGRGAQVRNF